MTHPFHPPFGRRFAFVDRRRNWSEDRVYFHDEQGGLCSVPTGWTDEAEVDAFVVVAAGRARSGSLTCSIWLIFSSGQTHLSPGLWVSKTWIRLRDLPKLVDQPAENLTSVKGACGVSAWR